MTLSKKEIFIFIGIVVLFLGLRLPGIHIPYHQDEYKWPLYSDPAIYAPGSVPHPPLTEYIYRVIAPHFGYSNFRLVPLIFSFLSLFLLFYLVKTIFDTPFDKLRASKTALWSTFLFSISFYSVLASLMIDVDGAVMPFFLLLSAIGYFKLKNSDWKDWKWGVLLIGASICGFLVKVVFVLPIIAMALDFAIEKKALSDKRKLRNYIFIAFGGVVALVLILLGIKFIFPFFNLGKAVVYWEHFAVFKNRGWMQTFIQFAKSILYTSPLLILPALFVDKVIWSKTRVFYFFIFSGLFFYLFAFDFSLGALDRYFEFLIVPLCIISGAVFSQNITYTKHIGSKIKDYIFPIIISILIFSIQFLSHSVPPLYPKTEWLHKALTLHWDFLFPFTGGSGPTGFYVSFAFIAMVWICSIIFFFSKKSFKVGVLCAILVLGLTYNIVFVEEYLFGFINGSPYALFEDAKAFIIKDKTIQSVIVYNDIGGYEIQQTGKYFRRMYAAPQFEEEYKKTLSQFNGHILFIDVPRIDSQSFYATYMSKCNEVFKETDKTITAKILDCRGVN